MNRALEIAKEIWVDYSKRNTLVFLVVLMVVHFVYFECPVGVKAQTEPVPNIVTTVKVSPSQVRIGEEFTVQIRVQNNEDFGFQFNFGGTMQYGIRVQGIEGILASYPSADFEMLTSFSIPAGMYREKEFRFKFDPPNESNYLYWSDSVSCLSPGLYDIHAGLLLAGEKIPWGVCSLELLE